MSRMINDHIWKIKVEAKLSVRTFSLDNETKFKNASLDNETKFKNVILNNFYNKKWIWMQYSTPRTTQ